MRVRAPASTANLGPGFDCLAAALTVSLEIDTSSDEALPEIVAKAVSAIAGGKSGGEVVSSIPVGKGLGSSGACVAAGLLLGCALAGRSADAEELLRIGTPIEGHPDNLAASLYGGITLALPDGKVMCFSPSGSVRPLVLVPVEKLSTQAARRVLPDEVSRADAVANIARASGLVSMLTGAAEATSERLLECTQDRLHQPPRAPLMPRTADALSYLRGRGIAAAVSGAGPSVVCLVLRGREDQVRSASSELDGWELLDVDWDLEGARILDA